MISRPAKLRREHFSLTVEQDQIAHIPFEDIAIIVLNHHDITLSHSVLSSCADYGICLYTTGNNHQPNGIFTPYLTHSRSTRFLRQQLDLGRPIAKQAKANIVRQKITNQSICLKLAGNENHDRLESYARRVRSGDPDNLEAQAAAFYFPQLFGTSFHRNEDGWCNAALNYGYAILRGAITRALVAHGLHPSIGLFHGSEQNSFNLADDLIEPFRPIIDLHVYKNFTATREQLSPNDKATLIGLLNVDVGMPQGKTSVLSAIEYLTESLARLLENNENNLDLPILIGLQSHRLDY